MPIRDVPAEALDHQAERRPSLARSASWTFLTNLLVAGLSLLNVLIVSRALGPTGRGDVAFLTAISMITASLACLGVQQANSNIGAREPERRRQLAGNALALSVVFGAIAIGIVALLIGLIPRVGGSTSVPLLALALGSVPVMILRNYLWALVLADYGYAWSNASWLIGPLVNVVGNGGMALVWHLSVPFAVGTWVVGQTIGDAVLVWFVARRSGGFGRPDLALVKRSLSFGIKAHLGTVLLVGNYRLDQWLVGSMSGFTELGLYSVAVAWGEALFFLPTALALVQRPHLARAAGRQEAAAAVAPVLRTALWLTLVFAGAMAAAAPFLCVTVFGSDFSGSVDDLRLLVPGGFGIVALKLLGNALTAQGRPLAETLAITVAFVCTIALDIALIPAYGGAGAALASTAAYLAGGLAAAVVFTRIMQTSLVDLVPRPSDLRDFARQLSATVASRSRRAPAAVVEPVAAAPGIRAIPPYDAPAADGVDRTGRVDRAGRVGDEIRAMIDGLLGTTSDSRLGVYVDTVYRRVRHPDGTFSVSGDRAFLLFAREVGSAYRRLVLFGRTVDVTEPADYALPDVTLVRLPHYTSLLHPFQVARALPGTIAAMWRGVGQVDVVWVIGPNPFDVLLILIACLRRRRLALGVRQDTVAYYRSRVPSRLWAPLVLGMRLIDVGYHLLARRVPTVVVGEEIARQYGAGRRSTVLPMTVSLMRESSVARAVPERSWDGPIRLLTVGRLEREKNPLLTVEALAELERRTPGRYRLTWVGRGPLEQEVLATAARLGVDRLLTLHGYVEFGERLFDLYRDAHVLVHVSLTEGVPQVIVEAIALGTPVVATAVGGIPGAFGEPDVALLVPPSDRDALVRAIERTVREHEERDARTARGLELAHRLTLESEAARVARFIGLPR